MSGSIHSTPTCSPTQSGHYQLSAPEWIRLAAMRVPPDFHFNAFQTNIKQFTFNHTPTALTPPHALTLALLPAGTPAIWEMNSPDSCHTAQNYNLPFGKSASGSIVFPEIELAHQQTLSDSPCPCSRLPLAPSPLSQSGPSPMWKLALENAPI